METIKKIRGKYSVDKKITVKHFLRKNKENNKFEYSIYVQLTVNRKVTNFKSKIVPFAIIEESEWENGNNRFYKKCIERDKGLIEYIVNELNPFDDDKFDIKKVSDIYNLDKVNLIYIFNSSLMREIDDNIKRLNGEGDFNPLNYLGFYQDLYPTLKIKASKYKSKIWYLETIILHLCQNSNNGEGYVMLNPTIYDYISGKFIESIKESDILNNEQIKNLTDDMKRLFELYSKSILNFN